MFHFILFQLQEKQAATIEARGCIVYDVLQTGHTYGVFGNMELQLHDE